MTLHLKAEDLKPILTLLWVCKNYLTLFQAGISYIYIYIQADSRQPSNSKMRKLEKSERRKSEDNSFLACSFPAAQMVRSGEANVQLLIFPSFRCPQELLNEPLDLKSRELKVFVGRRTKVRAETKFNREYPALYMEWFSFIIFVEFSRDICDVAKWLGNPSKRCLV